jgi:hypothetical protein
MEKGEEEDEEDFSNWGLDSQSQQPPADLRVQLVFYVFTANVAFCILSIVVASIPYFDMHVAWFHTRTGLAVAAAVAAASYAALCGGTALWGGAPAYESVLSGLLATWCAAWAVFVGFLAAFLGNTAPIQFMLISFGQSICIVIYTRISPRVLNMHAAAGLLALGGACMWIIGISGYVLEMDWPYAIGILVMCALLVVHNIRQIANTKDRYDASFAQGVLAVAHYFTYESLALCGMAQK